MTQRLRFRTHFSSLTERAKELTRKIVSHSDSGFAEKTRVKRVVATEPVVSEPSFSPTRFSFVFWLYGLLAVLLGFVVYHGFAVIVLIIAAYIISIAIE